ncbi:hypothetical protein MGN70_013931 [Eutypa lata]|nr:hypothetical protein MGN70_013931 [Eutypa lata]
MYTESMDNTASSVNPLHDEQYLESNKTKTQHNEEDPDDINNSDEDDEDDDDDDLYYVSWEDLAPKIQALCKTIWPTAHHDQTQLSFLAEGSYNKIVSVSLNTNEVHREYVIRIPCNESTILSSVAILRHLRQETKLKVPGVISYDNTRNNPLEYGYIVLEKVPGVPLEQCLDDLTQHQRLTLAREIGELYVQLRSIKYPAAGFLKVPLEETESFVDHPESCLIVEPYGASTDRFPWEINCEDASNEFIALDRLKKDPQDLPCDEMMLLPFRRRLYHFSHGPHPSTRRLEDLQFLLEMIQDMVKRGHFTNSQSSGFCLWHQDLWPRNIMVNLDASPMISGVLDWDDPVFAPAFIAATPPWWLWQNEEEEESVDSDVPIFEDSEMEPIAREALEADTPENSEVKRAFEDVVGQQWVHQAYQPEFAYARRALALARLSLWSDTHVLAFFEMKDMWLKHVQESMTGPIDTELDVKGGDNTHLELSDGEEERDFTIS